MYFTQILRSNRKGALAVCSLVFGCKGPVLDCPESIAAGEDVVLAASFVDDALEWTITLEDAGRGTFVLTDGSESATAITSVFRFGPTRAPSDHTEIILRAQATGIIRIDVRETTIGPGIGLPRPMGSDSCWIEIR